MSTADSQVHGCIVELLFNRAANIVIGGVVVVGGGL